METTNHEYYVSLEVAKLLKEAGFDWETFGYYNKLGFFHRAVPHNGETAAPTLAVAQKWLREVKNISVDISSTRYSEWEYIIRKINQANHNDNTISALTACRFYTHEEAQEAGIQKCLEILLEEKK